MDPIFELKKAVVDNLKANSAVNTATGGRIYDVVPEGEGTEPLTSPYISLGSWSDVADSRDCIEAIEINARIDVYSWGINEAQSTKEATGLADLIRRSLKGLTELSVNALEEFVYRGSTTNTASDGQTKQVVLEYRANVEITP